MLRYILYIIDEKPKIHHFLTFFPVMFKEWIEYDNPKMLEEAMKKTNFCYDQNKNKRESIPIWKTKGRNNFDPRKKNNKFHKNIVNNYKGHQGNKYKNYKPHNSAVKKK